MKKDRNRGRDNAEARALRAQKLRLRKEQVQRLHAAGLTEKEISARLSMDWRTVVKIREEFGLKPNAGDFL